MIHLIQRAIMRLKRFRYKNHWSTPTKPTQRRELATRALRVLPKDHPDYGLLKDYVAGVSIDALSVSWHMSESTVNRHINRLI